MLLEFSRGIVASFKRCMACGFVLGAAAWSCEPNWRDLTSETDAAPRAGVGGSPGGSSGGGCLGSSCDKGGDAAQGGSPTGGSSAGKGGTETAATSGGARGSEGGAGGAAENGGAGDGGAAPVDDGSVDLPGTATADSEETAKNNLAPNAHDGDEATKWVAADGELGHFWTLDLGTVHRLTRLKIRWEYPHGMVSVSYGYTVAVSDDGIKYQLAIDKQDNQETTQDQVARMPADTAGRFVRITVTGLPGPPPPNQDYWASFYEARVFGYPEQF